MHPLILIILNRKTSDTPIVEGKENIAVVDTIADLPTEKIEDVLYKVKENQKFYYWNDTKAAYEILNETQQAVEGKSNILVVNKFDELPETGEADVLYKVIADQALYNYNTLTKAYENQGKQVAVLLKKDIILLSNLQLTVYLPHLKAIQQN